MLIYCFCSILLYGSPDKWSGGQVGNLGSGHLSLLSSGNIKVLFEDVYVALYKGQARVTVNYVLKNNNETNANIVCGFPFVIYTNGYNVRRWHYTSDISNYSIKENNEKIKFTYSRGSYISWINAAKNRKEPLVRYAWHKSKLQFAGNEIKRITVSYTTKYFYSVNRIANDTIYSGEQFRYFLFTGATWKGAVKSGRITIDPINVDRHNIKISFPDRFYEKNGKYIFDFINKKVSFSDTILINITNRNRSIITERDNKKNICWEINTKIFQSVHADFIKASSQLKGKKYNVKNISDLRKDTAWFAGLYSDGAGEYIEARFNNGVMIDRIAVIPGYAKSDSLYFGNNRIRLFSVIINGFHYTKSKFIDYFFDYSDDQYQLYDYIDISSFQNKIYTIKLVIADIYKGNTGNLTGVSEIIFLKKIKKIPDTIIK